MNALTDFTTSTHAGFYADLAAVEAGASARQYIVDRAVSLAEMADAGIAEAAEDIATEIDRLQDAQLAKMIGAENVGNGITRGRALWSAPLAEWADALLHGWTVSRFFQVHPDDADTLESARDQAQRIFDLTDAQSDGIERVGIKSRRGVAA